MFDRNSDYALNKKDPEAIVCKSATGVHIRLTRNDFSSEAQFEKWKHWSDEDYHAAERADIAMTTARSPWRAWLNSPSPYSLPRQRSWISMIGRREPVCAVCWPRDWRPA